jgi:hypothetical protein
MPTTKGDNMANVKLTRTNNIWGSYEYTHNGVRYEIVNPNKGDREAPNEWRVQEWSGWEIIFQADTLQEVREFFANGMWG